MPSATTSSIPSLPDLEKLTVATPEAATDPKEDAAKEEQARKDMEAATLEAAKLQQGVEAQQASAVNNAPTEAAPYQVAPPMMLEPPPVPDAEVTAATITPPPSLSIPAPPAALELAATSIPETPAVAATPARPTWEDVLKPSYEPVKTNFNFRRQVLPSVIYRDQYGNANRHLPLARSSEQYDHYFILAVARNDLNAIRAMLANGRRNVNLMNAEGDPMLIVAIRHNAIAAARLLLARGANPSALGQNGMSAMDYAQYLGNQELISALREHLS